MDTGVCGVWYVVCVCVCVCMCVCVCGNTVCISSVCEQPLFLYMCILSHDLHGEDPAIVLK